MWILVKKSAHYIYIFYLGLWRLWKCYWNGEFERVLKAEVTGSVDYISWTYDTSYIQLHKLKLRHYRWLLKSIDHPALKYQKYGLFFSSIYNKKIVL